MGTKEKTRLTKSNEVRLLESLYKNSAYLKSKHYLKAIKVYQEYIGLEFDFNNQKLAMLINKLNKEFKKPEVAYSKDKNQNDIAKKLSTKLKQQSALQLEINELAKKL